MANGERVNANIKRKERQYRKEGDKLSPEPWIPRKRRIIRARSSINFSDEVQRSAPPKPLFGDQGLAFPTHAL